MEKIKLLVISLFLTYFWLSSWITQAYYDDNIDWSDAEVDYTYDYSTQKLNVKLSIPEDTTPRNSYYVNFTIDWDTYKKDLSYSSWNDELYLNYDVYINSSNIQDSYDMYLKIVNKSTYDVEFTDTISWDIDNILDWNNLELTNSYNSNTEYLKVTVALENIEENPTWTVYSYLKINWKNSSEKFTYSSSDDKYYATHAIFIDRDDLENDYEYTLNIKNSNNSIIFTTEDTLTVDENVSNSYYSSSSDEDLYWDDLVISSDYNERNEKLSILFELEDITSTPNYSYYAKLKINWKTYTKDLSYSSSNDKLSWTFTINIDEDDIENSYDIDYSIFNKKKTKTVYSQEDISLNTYWTIFNNSSNYSTSTNTKDNFNWKNTILSSVYNKDTELLTIKFELNNLQKFPDNNYYVKVKFLWKYYTRIINYDSYTDKATWILTIQIDKNDIKNYYNINYSVVNENKSKTEYSKDNYKLNTSFNINNQTSYSWNYTVKVYTNTAEKLANNYINNATKTYADYRDIILYLNWIVTKLDTIAQKNPTLKTIAEQVSEILNDKISDLRDENNYYYDVNTIETNYTPTKK